MNAFARGVPLDRLPNRVVGALYRGGVETHEDIVACPEDHVRCINGIGKGAMNEIRSLLASEGRWFAPPRSWKGCGCPACVHEAERMKGLPRIDLSDLLPGLVRELGGDNVLAFRPRGAS
jgi:hypothetical protein